MRSQRRRAVARVSRARPRPASRPRRPLANLRCRLDVSRERVRRSRVRPVSLLTAATLVAVVATARLHSEAQLNERRSRAAGWPWRVDAGREREAAAAFFRVAPEPRAARTASYQLGAQEPAEPVIVKRQPAARAGSTEKLDAQAYRHLVDPDHRRGADRHRPGSRVRLFGKPGRQGAEGRRLSRDRRQFEPGDDHDRSGAGGRYLYRADHARRSSPRSCEKERPDALLPTMGGQTALNTALALFKDGTLDRLGVELIGANAEAIEKAEDRLKFREAMDKIGLESPRSAIAHSLEGAAGGAGYMSGCRRSSGRASRSAGRAAASPTTATSSRRSFGAGSRPARPAKC